jgi:menaquinol-cytochrome c reductase iron-sulfur subunit
MSSSPPSSSSDESTADRHSTSSAPSSRRNVLVQFVAAAISVVIVAVPGILGSLFFLDPILRKRRGAQGGAAAGEIARKDEAGFIRLEITRDAIPADGTPVAVTVLDDIIDAWNRFRNVPIGSIWLRKLGDGPILAFNSVCPHLGCSVNYRRAEGDFFCPCHTSAFDLDGKKTNEVPPRDMDTLEVAMRTNGQDDSNGAEIWVRYQNFQRATTEKIAI